MFGENAMHGLDDVAPHSKIAQGALGVEKDHRLTPALRPSQGPRASASAGGETAHLRIAGARLSGRRSMKPVSSAAWDTYHLQPRMVEVAPDELPRFGHHVTRPDP
jgi:hypothetical protein